MISQDDIDAMGHEPDHERGSYMSTYSGGKFFPLDPKAEEIVIEDIAHALSLTNRFNGHTRWPYTVAQHSVLVYQLCRDKYDDVNLLKYALLHDAAEAYIGDVIRPFKYYLPFFKECEDKIMDAVADKFGFVMTQWVRDRVKEADNLACAAEKRDLHPTKIEWPNMPDPSGVEFIKPWNHSYAKGAFMRAYRDLS